MSQRNPNRRRLKVSASYRNRKFVPQLSLAGFWMRNAGFCEGDILDVTIAGNRILIEKK